MRVHDNIIVLKKYFEKYFIVLLELSVDAPFLEFKVFFNEVCSEINIGDIIIIIRKPNV